MRKSWGVALAVLMLASCGGKAAKRTNAVQADVAAAGDPQFAADADRLYRVLVDLDPTFAVWLGLHDHDGKLADNSAAGLEQQRAVLEQARKTLLAAPLGKLSPTQRIEREMMLSFVNRAWFDLVERRAPWRSPHTYLFGVDFAGYITRDYAPAAERAKAASALARALSVSLANAQKNLDAKLPRPSIQFSIMMAGGMVDFLSKDVPAAFADLKDETVALDLAQSLQMATSALGAYVAFLKARMPDATDDFALGPDKFLAMLEATEGIRTDLATLKRVAEADLAKNWAALDAAAKQIDPGKPTAEVVAAVLAKTRVAGGEVVASGQQMVADFRKFVEAQNLVTIPAGSGDATVAVSPSFMRQNLAFLRSAGVFEIAGQPSFYYITPPDPSWPEAEQTAYLPSRGSLLAITAHEVWPGHYLAFEYRKRAPTKVLQSFQSYTMSEGWAHYTEELVMVGELDTPELRVGQLLAALMRDVRFLAALGLHTEGMTLEAATRLFAEKALLDPGNSRQQAMRGTLDPMYLSYTLGKLIIQKLRVDAEARAARENRKFSLRAFHDEFLSYGNPPLPAIREAMLGPGAGPVL